MSWSRSSKAVVALLVLLSAAAPVAAVSTSASGVPDEAQVGEEREANYTLTELYADGTQEWTLTGRSNMTGVQWTVEKHKLGGNVETQSFSGSNFSVQVSSNDDVERVVVTVRGTTPGIDNYTYDPAETYLFAELNKTAGDAVEVVRTDEAHQYTNESKQARDAIKSAEATVEAAGGDEEAERLIRNAISAYEQENFDNAVDLAEQAQEAAEQTQRASNRNELIIYAVLGLIALLVLAGGVYYWRSQRDTYDKLG